VSELTKCHLDVDGEVMREELGVLK
jgi:hypothetical protein